MVPATVTRGLSYQLQGNRPHPRRHAQRSACSRLPQWKSSFQMVPGYIKLTVQTYGHNLVPVSHQMDSVRQADSGRPCLKFVTALCVWGGCSFPSPMDEEQLGRSSHPRWRSLSSAPALPLLRLSLDHWCQVRAWMGCCQYSLFLKDHGRSA